MKKIVLTTISLATFLLASQQPYEVSITAGGTKAESDMKLEHHQNYGVRFGMDNNLVLEKMFDKIEYIYERSNDADYKDSALETDINRYSVNFLHSYTNYGNLVPYGLVGVGYEDFKNEYLKANDSVTANLGLGVKYYLNEAVSLRAEIRDQMNLEHGVQHELLYSLGLGYAFGATAQPQEIVEEVQEPVVVAQKEPVVVKEVVLLDTDGDGVYDKDDKCPRTLTGFNVDSDGCALDYTFDLNFDSSKYDVKEEYTERLRKFVDFMNMKPNYKAVINGHTDSSGSSKYNMKLSTQRAKSVMEKLIELGLDSSRVSFKGYGESTPIASNETLEGKLQNRRIEAEIIK